jgi:regulatory protein
MQAMPRIVTKIEQQKKNTKRYSIFSGEHFVTGISAETLLALNIHPGTALSEKVLNEINRKEELVAIREQAWRYLARREHSTKELSEKLTRKNFSQILISQLIKDLKAKDYLNDKRYARQLINDEVYLKKNGPLLIKATLLKKGIEINLIDELLQEVYQEDLQLENCSALAGKKIKILESLEPDGQKKRLVTFLARKGYAWEIVSRVLTNLIDTGFQAET